MLASSLVVALLAQAPAVDPSAPLPPNHPPMGAVDPAAGLPPNHPKVPPANTLPNHPPVAPGQQAPSADELLKKLDGVQGLDTKEKTFEVAVSLGRLYFAHGRYKEAVTFFDQARAKTKEARELYEAKKKAAGSKPLPAAGAVGCGMTPETTLEQQVAAAKAQKDAAAAAACARAALHPLIELEPSLAQAKFLTRDAKGALEVYDAALALFESNADARYGRGALLLDTKGDDLKALALAKADLTRFLADFPTSPRAKQAKAFLARVDEAIAAGGVSKLKPKAHADKVDPHAAMKGKDGAPPQLTPEMIEAVKNVEQTPELAAGFEKLVADAEDALAKGKFQDALDNYKRVVPFQPENGRAKAGMAWSLVRLNRQPMADNIWRVATQDPAACDALGDSLKAKGDADGAKALWKKLAETSPAYAPKLTGKL